MSMKKYKLSFLPLFEADLIEITDYISNRLNNPEAALRLVDDIEIAINRRLETPLTFSHTNTSVYRFKVSSIFISIPFALLKAQNVMKMFP